MIFHYGSDFTLKLEGTLHTPLVLAFHLCIKKMDSFEFFLDFSVKQILIENSSCLIFGNIP